MRSRGDEPTIRPKLGRGPHFPAVFDTGHGRSIVAETRTCVQYSVDTEVMSQFLSRPRCGGGGRLPRRGSPGSAAPVWLACHGFSSAGSKGSSAPGTYQPSITLTTAFVMQRRTRRYCNGDVWLARGRRRRTSAPRRVRSRAEPALLPCRDAPRGLARRRPRYARTGGLEPDVQAAWSAGARSSALASTVSGIVTMRRPSRFRT